MNIDLRIIKELAKQVGLDYKSTRQNSVFSEQIYYQRLENFLKLVYNYKESPVDYDMFRCNTCGQVSKELFNKDVPPNPYFCKNCLITGSNWDHYSDLPAPVYYKEKL
jgi:late competence protein required for DNA uptake (superfamily II DNA/RNA helicase)